MVSPRSPVPVRKSCGPGRLATPEVLDVLWTPLKAWSYQPSESSQEMTTAVLEQSGVRSSALISLTMNCCSSKGSE